MTFGNFISAQVQMLTAGLTFGEGMALILLGFILWRLRRR